jgi:membrane-bound lytic murein transglycosylase D
MRHLLFYFVIVFAFLESKGEPQFPIDDVNAPYGGVADAEICKSIQSNPSLQEELLSEIKNIFLQEGIPSEYVCIAKIESNFDPKAVSSAGAAGIFQLMPDTARRFGLIVEDGMDERFDPLKSAQAAARYLNFLKNYFNSWFLAIAAYNAGEGRVARALQDVDISTKDFEAILAMLPEETQRYVPKVLAALNINSFNSTLIK